MRADKSDLATLEGMLMTRLSHSCWLLTYNDNMIWCLCVWVCVCMCVCLCMYVCMCVCVLCVGMCVCICICAVFMCMSILYSEKTTDHITKSRAQVIHSVHTTAHKTSTLQHFIQWMNHQWQHIPLSFLSNNIKHSNHHHSTHLVQTCQHYGHCLTVVKATSLWSNMTL